MTDRNTRERRPGDVTGQQFRKQALARAREIREAAIEAHAEEIAAQLAAEEDQEIIVVDYTGSNHGQV